MKAYLSKAERERLIALMLIAGCDKDEIAKWSNGIQKSGADCEHPGPLGIVVEGRIFFAQIHETYFDARQPTLIKAVPGTLIGGGV